MELKVIKLPIKDLKPYDKNAKKHPRKQIKEIANSIREFGMNDPIGIWGDKNLIVEGHGRLEACKSLGMSEVPCIRLDHLTDEQRRAYTLAHNKVAESEFDFDLLDEEMNEIFNIDMEQFGFEFVDEDIEKQKNKEQTQKRVANILNLELAQFEGVGKYDIPPIEPVKSIPKIKEWIGFNYVLSDKEPEGKGVHFFIDDYQFMRVWHNPDAYVEKLKQYEAVIAPDFSPYGDMPLATQIFNHYRKHWIAKYLQERGVNIIPCVRASTDERSLEFYLEGEPRGGIVCISSMWVNKSKELKDYFMREYELMYKTLKPCKVLVYGSEIEGLEGNIEYIETFTSRRWKKDG